MDLDELTVGQLKEIKSMVGGSKCASSSPYKVGKAYFIRTVTHYYTGRLKTLFNDALLLEEVCWIADTGRFYNFLKEGKANEVEPFQQDVIIPRDSIIDATEWTHKLPKDQK